MKLIKIKQYLNDDCWEILFNPSKVIKIETHKKENVYTIYTDHQNGLIHTDKKGYNKIMNTN